MQRVTSGFYLFCKGIRCGLYFCWILSSDHVVYSTMQRLTSGFYLFCEVYSLRYVILLDLILRSCDVFHNAEGNLWVLFVLQGVFLAICSSVGLGPQIMWCIPNCRELPLIFICLRGVFLAVWSSVGLCPQTMWCIPHCRGLSSH